MRVKVKKLGKLSVFAGTALGLLAVYSPARASISGRMGSDCREGILAAPVSFLNAEDPGFARCFGVAGKVGGILPGQSHAWGENVGWIDFRSAEADLRVGGNILAGWIRVENLGWVHLGNGQPADGRSYSNRHGHDYGVNNDGRGNLSGWAWSETVGWISFDGVAIGGDGTFSGCAASENAGRIEFQSDDSAGYLVRTDPYPWKGIGRGVAVRAGNGGNPGGGESIGLSPTASKFTVPSPKSPFYSPALGKERIENEPVLRLSDSGGRLFRTILDRSRPSRGPPGKENIESLTDRFPRIYSNPAFA